MAKLPEMTSPTLKIIDDRTKGGSQDWRRAHLGASAIGDPCERRLWYDFRWFTAPDFSGRILRLFRRGQNEEVTIVADLRLAGVTVSEGPSEGKQWRFNKFGGHYGGSMDAAILGLHEAPKAWHVGEFKTHNRKSFDSLLKNGVQKSKERHYAQMQAYMHNFGMKRAVYVAVCKDTDRYYLERVNYDKYFAGELEDKARRVIFADSPPPKLSERPDYYACKWCDHYGICHQNVHAEERNCRTCVSSSADEDGSWRCASASGVFERCNWPVLTLDQQKTLADTSCDSHLMRDT